MHASNFVTSSQDLYIKFVKSVIDLKNLKNLSFFKARIISKQGILGRNRRTAAVLSKRELPVHNKTVGIYDIY